MISLSWSNVASKGIFNYGVRAYLIFTDKTSRVKNRKPSQEVPELRGFQILSQPLVTGKHRTEPLTGTVWV